MESSRFILMINDLYQAIRGKLATRKDEEKGRGSNTGNNLSPVNVFKIPPPNDFANRVDVFSAFLSIVALWTIVPDIFACFAAS